MYDRKKIRTAQNVTDVSFFCSEAIQARYHTQRATTYNSANLEQAPVMVE